MNILQEISATVTRLQQQVYSNEMISPEYASDYSHDLAALAELNKELYIIEAEMQKRRKADLDQMVREVLNDV